MTKSELFKAAHKIARKTKSNRGFVSHSLAPFAISTQELQA